MVKNGINEESLLNGKTGKKRLVIVASYQLTSPHAAKNSNATKLYTIHIH